MGSGTEQIVKLAFFFLGIFPALPFRLKPIGVVLLFFCALLNYKSYKKLNTTPLLYFLALYLSYAFSNFLSGNFLGSVDDLSTMFSFISVPLSVTMLYDKIIEHNKNMFKLYWILSTTLISAVVIFYSTQIILDNNRFLVNHLVSTLNRFKYWDMHPIYLSIYLVVSNIFCLEKIKRAPNMNVLSLFFFLFNGVSIVLLGRKSSVAFLFIMTLILVFILISKKGQQKYAFLTLLTLSFLTVSFFSEFPKRAMELFLVRSYNSLDSFSSTAIRYNALKSVVNNISHIPFFGFGFDQAEQILISWYPEKMPSYFNTHNQYLGTLMVSGYVGLITLLALLRELFLRTKTSFMLSTLLLFFVYIMLFENIFDRQNGVIVFTLIYVLLRPNEHTSNRTSSQPDNRTFHSQ